MDQEVREEEAFKDGKEEGLAEGNAEGITKGEKKVGGRWYYSGGDLLTPLYKYGRVDFDEVNDFDYDFECDGGKFKVKNDFTF